MSSKDALRASHAAKGDLTSGDLNRHLIRLSTPMIFGILAIVSFQLADTYFLSLLGTDELAAISLTFPFAMALLNFFIGISIAVSSVLARQIGAKNHDAVQRIAGHGLIFAFLVALAGTLICFAFLDPLLTMMGADTVTKPLARSYMDIWLWSNLFIALPMAANAAMRAGGDAMLPAIIMNAAALLNIILDPLLIFGIGPFPRLEMQGAAIATIFANLLSTILALYILYARKKMVFRNGLHLRLFADSAKRLLFIALPAGLTGMINPVISGFIIALLAASGSAAIAAYGVAMRIEGFAFVILMGLASGMGPILGQNWGAHHYERVNKTLNKALAFSALWSILVALPLALLGRPLAGIFSDQAEMIEIAVWFFWLVPPTYVFGNLAQGWSSAFHALGLPIQALALMVIKSIILTIPLALLGAHYYGYIGIFAALAAVNVITGVAAHIWGRHLLRTRRNGSRATQPAPRIT